MAYSEVEIVNLALTELGKTAIRDFSITDTDPITGRLGKRVYQASRDLLLSGHDWTFARVTIALQQRAETHPKGVLYALPSDCYVARRVEPRSGRPNTWSVEGRSLIIPLDRVVSLGTQPLLRYTKQLTNTALFPPYFVDALMYEIARRISKPLTANAELSSELKKDAKASLLNAKLIDANIGEGDDHHQQDLDYDTFVAIDVPGEAFNG